MQRDVLKALYDVHSWVGLFLGLALYVLLFSGSVALFIGEMRPWELGVTSTPRETAVAALESVVQHPQGAAPEATHFSIRPASGYRPWITRETGDDHDGDPALVYFDPLTGAPVTIDDEHVVHVLEKLHTDLLLPAPWGRYLTGLLGVAMLVSLVSGVFMHRKILREMWAVRIWRSPRLKWTDLHKLVAVWGLPYHVVMAFTGTYLGLVGFTLLLNAFVAFGGDADAASAGISGVPQEAVGEADDMLPLRDLLARAQAALPGLEPEYLGYRHYGDRGATLMVLGHLPWTLEYLPGVTLSAVTGEQLQLIHWREESWTKALYAMMTPLHYGSYGGLLLKALYALLGLGASFLVVSGLRIWQLRVHPGGGDLRIALFNGVCYGLPYAIAISLSAARLLTGPAFSSYQGRLLLFLFAWLTALGIAIWRRGDAGMVLSLCTGVALVLLPLATELGDRASILSALRTAPTSPLAIVEMSLALIGLAVVLIAWRVRRSQGRQPFAR